MQQMNHPGCAGLRRDRSRRTTARTRKQSPRFGLACGFVAVLLSATGDPSSAQGLATPATRATAITTAQPPDDEPEIDEVRFAIGTAVSVSPKYSGSDEIGFAIAPAARILWRGYSISTSSVSRASSSTGSSRSTETGLSGPLVRRSRFAFGFGASLSRGRSVSEEDARIGLKDIPATLIGRMRMRYSITEDVSLSAMIVGDLLGRQKGLDVPFGIGWRREVEPGLLLTADIGATWGTAKSIDNGYGIGAAEQAASGLPLYRPHSGLREVAGSLGLVYEPSEHWVFVARLTLVRLVGQVAGSPLVKEPLQPALLLGFAYRFTLY